MMKVEDCTVGTIFILLYTLIASVDRLFILNIFISGGIATFIESYIFHWRISKLERKWREKGFPFSLNCESQFTSHGNFREIFLL
eukprot:UN24236